MTDGAVSGDRLRTLVIQTAFLGDVVLTTPLLTALAERHGPVDVVTTPAAAALLEAHPAVRDGHPVRQAGRRRGAGRGPASRAPRSGRAGYARAYLPAPLLALGGAGAAGAARRSARLRGQRRPRLPIPRASPRPRDGPRGRAAARPGRPARRRRAPGLTGTWRRGRARRRPLARRARSAGPSFVAAGARLDLGHQALALLSRARGRGSSGPIVVIGGREDAALAEAIVAAAPGRAWSAAGALSLRASAAADRARRGAGHQRLGAAAPGDRGRHAGRGALRTHRAGVRLRATRRAESRAGARGARLPALLGTWAGGVPAGSSPLHAGAAVETVADAVAMVEDAEESACDSSSALTSAGPTWSSAAWPRTARALQALASEPTHAEAGASDVVDRLVALAQRVHRRAPSARCRAPRSSASASARPARSTPRAASCCSRPTSAG